MSSLFKLNQLSIPQEAALLKEGQKTALENRDREIYALRQQLQTLKTLYKNAKIQTTPQKNPVETISGNEHPRQIHEKMNAVLGEIEKLRAQHDEAEQRQAFVFKEYCKEKQARQAAFDEIKALHGQVEFLKTKLITNHPDHRY